MKKRIIKYGIGMLLIGLVIGLLVTHVLLKKKESFDVSVFDKEENIIVYLRNNPSKYAEVGMSDKFISYYKNVYQIPIYTVDCSKLDDKSLSTIYKYLALEKPYDHFPYDT